MASIAPAKTLYDSLGQVVSGKRYWQDGTPIAGQQFEYAFDQIGNRTWTGVGGNASGSGLRGASYVANKLNQYDYRDVPEYVDVTGIANPTAPVTVNGNTATRQGEYFHYALQTPNGAQPWYSESIQIASTYGGGQSETRTNFVPKNREYFSYDDDGNLTNDGRWAFTWDAENRLVKMEPSGTFAPPAGSRRMLEFAYDHLGRRIWQRITNLDAPGATENRFVYDGWNLIATLNSQLSTLSSYVWGLDLSGSMQGAGGVGGLLKVTYNGAATTNCFAAFDGNGNVIGLVDAANGEAVARYDYGSFGELVRMTGPMAKANPFRFSTKYQDDETDLLYYGYRYYNASTGRWVSRDPIAEKGGLNVLAFLRNNSVSSYDFLGKLQLTYHQGTQTPLPCGGFKSWITWSLDRSTGKADPVLGGIIVQYVSVSFDIKLCDDVRSPYRFGPPSVASNVDPKDWPFYEAWQIPPGGSRPYPLDSSPLHDVWQMPALESTHKGLSL